MVDFVRQHWAYLIGAVLLHVLFAGIFGLTLISLSRNPPPVQLAIQAVVVSSSQLPASRQQREREQAEAEQRRQQQQAQARREAEQRAEQERQVELQQRALEEKRKQAEEQQLRERQDAERKAAEAAAQKQRQAEAERKRVAEIERKQKEEAQRRKAAEEAKAQAARQDELRNQLAEEEGRMQAEKSGLLNEYVAMIEQRIVRNWNRPPSARAGLECEVKVTQAPGGTVLSVNIGRCNGDAAVKESIEAAVMRASPLPPPPDARLFERNLVLIFRPLD